MNWNERPLVEFIINFSNEVKQHTRVGSIEFLSRQLADIQSDLVMFHKSNTNGELNAEIFQWEIKEDIHKLTIGLIS